MTSADGHPDGRPGAVVRAVLTRSLAFVAIRDHGDPGDRPSAPPPLRPPTNDARPSAAEQARTIAAATNAATLATLTVDGDPWASLVAYGLLDGMPVLCVSSLAEHGRNLVGDPRASLSIVAAGGDTDPLARSRITLAGLVAKPTGSGRDKARAAYLDSVPAARSYLDFNDFSLWVLRVQRVRWVGGYGRMDSATGDQYAAASPDPIAPAAARARAHLNADHADALAAMARTFGGYPDTDSAMCTGVDRYGLDLRVDTPRGTAYARVGFPARLDSVDQLRSAAADLARAADPGY
ncbi:heme iron utilization protein [Mycobacterium europaeum]|uniref:Heme iron utilization protein n=1 Tax=Mycobacterium europaeum TaxID=761804 RepID=A0A0U1DTY6_9MYCO|nr:heme iron utilization protein [Mycobacterium europaeum]